MNGAAGGGVCSCLSRARAAPPLAARWAKNGITKKNFKESLSRVDQMRMTHYQIIGGKLYRTESCMFEPRCRGVEYFFHWLLEEDKRGTSTKPLPDMEFVLNTRDNPMSCVRRPPALPLPPCPLVSPRLPCSARRAPCTKRAPAPPRPRVRATATTRRTSGRCSRSA